MQSKLIKILDYFFFGDTHAILNTDKNLYWAGYKDYRKDDPFKGSKKFLKSILVNYSYLFSEGNHVVIKVKMLK